MPLKASTTSSGANAVGSGASGSGSGGAGSSGGSLAGPPPPTWRSCLRESLCCCLASASGSLDDGSPASGVGGGGGGGTRWCCRCCTPAGARACASTAAAAVCSPLLFCRALLARKGAAQLVVVTALGVVGFVITLTLYFLDIAAQDDANRTEYVGASLALVEFARRALVISVTALAQMMAAMNEAGLTSAGPVAFRSLGQLVVNQVALVSNAGFVRAVPASDRTEWERRMSEALGTHVDITNITTGAAAGAAAMYYPIESITTSFARSTGIGLDFGSEPARAAAITRAMTTGFTGTTAPLYSSVDADNVMAVVRAVWVNASVNMSLYAAPPTFTLPPGGMPSAPGAQMPTHGQPDTDFGYWANTSKPYGAIVLFTNASTWFNILHAGLHSTTFGLGTEGTTDGFLHHRIGALLVEDVTNTPPRTSRWPSRYTDGVVPIPATDVVGGGVFFFGGVQVDADSNDIVTPGSMPPVEPDEISFTLSQATTLRHVAQSAASDHGVVSSYLVGVGGRTLAWVRCVATSAAVVGATHTVIPRTHPPRPHRHPHCRP